MCNCYIFKTSWEVFELVWKHVDIWAILELPLMADYGDGSSGSQSIGVFKEVLKQ